MYILGQNVSEFGAGLAHMETMCHISDIIPTKGMS